MWKKQFSIGAIGLILLSLWGMIILLQQRIDRQRGEFPQITSFHYLPSGEYLRIASLEYREVVADVLWLQAIQFVGGKDPSGRGYEWFYTVLDRVTDLDPKFAYAYELGGIVLSVLSDQVRLSNEILEKGLRYNPEDWKIPFHLGFNYLYHVQIKDNLKAAKYMEAASRLEGSPAYLPLLTARLYNEAGEKQTTLAFLEGMYRVSKDENIRERIAQRMEEIMKEEDTAALK